MTKRVTTFYKTDTGKIAPIRVSSSEVIKAPNTPPAGPADKDFPHAKVSLTRRDYGIRPRYITLKQTGTAIPGIESSTLIKLPILDPAVYGSIGLYSTYNYKSTDLTVIAKEGEKIR